MVEAHASRFDVRIVFMLSVPGYPEWLEQWWSRYACEMLSCASVNQALPRLEREIQKLSDRFTVDRSSDFGDIYHDKNQLLAYGLFFFPQTFVRIQFPLLELLMRGWKVSLDRPVRVLDVGAGSGAAGMSVARILLENEVNAVEIVATDRSEGSLLLLRRIIGQLSEFFPRTNWKTVVADASSPENLGEFDLIVISFSLGELFANKSASAIQDWLGKKSQCLTRNGVILITEPALKETSTKLEQLRDLVAARRNLHIWGPCLHHSDCPLLKEGKFWCHEVRRWKVPQSLQSLNRHLYRSIHLLKFSFLTLGNQPPEPYSDNYFRLVSPMAKMKGKYVASGCAADGQIRQYEILRRNLDPSREAFLKACERGDILRL
jgi:ribosomal protein RSM22 (predicted rRNA methylase)